METLLHVIHLEQLRDIIFPSLLSLFERVLRSLIILRKYCGFAQILHLCHTATIALMTYCVSRKGE